MFQISHDKQIQKLSLGVQFDQEFMEKTWETSCCKLNRTDCKSRDSVPSKNKSNFTLKECFIYKSQQKILNLLSVLLHSLFCQS